MQTLDGTLATGPTLVRTGFVAPCVFAVNSVGSVVLVLGLFVLRFGVFFLDPCPRRGEGSVGTLERCVPVLISFRGIKGSDPRCLERPIAEFAGYLDLQLLETWTVSKSVPHPV